MDKAAFSTAVKQYQDMVFRIALQHLGSRQEAEDVVQDVFLRLYLQEQEFENMENVRRWLARVAVNASRDVLRSARWKKRAALDEEIPAPEFKTTEQSELYGEVMKLQEKYRTVLYLFYFEEFSVKEISELLNIRESLVTTRLFRARMQLRERLTEVWKDEQ